MKHFTWLPPRRFDFARTELVYVPTEHEKQHVGFILKNYLNPGGKLLVANYIEGLTQQEIGRGIIKGSHAVSDIILRHIELGFAPVNHKDGYVQIKNGKVRIAILNRESLLI